MTAMFRECARQQKSINEQGFTGAGSSWAHVLAGMFSGGRRKQDVRPGEKTWLFLGGISWHLVWPKMFFGTVRSFLPPAAKNVCQFPDGQLRTRISLTNATAYPVCLATWHWSFARSRRSLFEFGMNLSLGILLCVFLLIACRKIGRIPVRIWQAMLAGAILAVLTGQISPVDAIQAIDPDVMIFLFGMFVVGEALILSGYLSSLAYRGLRGIRSAEGLVAALLIYAATGSALLMNDTLAIMGTPLVLRLAREHRLNPQLMLMTLALAVTTGSVMSPIGNPQNLLIAIRGPVPSPFLAFIQLLGIPTVVNLLLAFLVLRITMPDSFHAEELDHSALPLADPALARLSRVSLLIIPALIVIKVFGVSLGWPVDIHLSAIAVAAASPLVLCSPRRLTLLRRVDWPTLIFFAAMFVLMASVWRTGVLQNGVTGMQLDLQRVPTLLGFSVLLSQLVSNVPLVALSLPLIGNGQGAPLALMALAAGSTIAGNLFILGAASNVIIIQRAEQEGCTLTFWTFARVGIPLTICQTLVYGLYFGYLGSGT